MAKVNVEYSPKVIECQSKRDSKDARDAVLTVKDETISNCVNVPTDIEAITRGVVAKIPVVLAELRLQVNINSIIELPEYAYEIKNIKKKVKITQCLLIRDTGMLFIKGFVRKNIDYSTRSGSNSRSFHGDIRHFTVDVPFTCTTEVFFNGFQPAPVIDNTSREFEYLMQQDLTGPSFGTKDKLQSSDTTEFNQVSTEEFNELPYCELIRAEIVEFDEALNPTGFDHSYMPFEERKFRVLEEKMVLYITLKLLQNRQVAIPAIGGVGPC
ncbi:CsxC family protein [Alkaliphilus hydrothermalis]|uniref:DUF7852 domain-containing protein n=1 Tax=Alkaliphilus hydrothermalis TaxID=1482730 RepID=A0ABS2NMW9_9FIRM|nr:hypothetical protein [Alkaliphilus hydrothermalis]MBM7614295.1 hypothetical protein [Alkaliphilus hydrothermalis]